MNNQHVVVTISGCRPSDRERHVAWDKWAESSNCFNIYEAELDIRMYSRCSGTVPIAERSLLTYCRHTLHIIPHSACLTEGRSRKSSGLSGSLRPYGRNPTRSPLLQLELNRCYCKVHHCSWFFHSMCQASYSPSRFSILVFLSLTVTIDQYATTPEQLHSCEALIYVYLS